MWVTFDTVQSRSMLEGRDHIFVSYTASRDLAGVLRNIPAARRILRRTRPSLVVSTGNAIALSFLPVARAAGIPTAYIESAARAEGPSLTGRVLRCVPGVRLYSQYPEWAAPPWGFVGSVFDQFAPAGGFAPRPLKRILVTAGTIPYGFRRLIERLVAILPTGSDVVWQVGDTDVSGLGITAHKTMPAHDLQTEIRRADVVIAHAGIGSALAALEAGRSPVLVPRERRHGEHVDDHQRQIAARLDSLGLATYRTVDELTVDDIVRAAGHRVIRRPQLPALTILGGQRPSRRHRGLVTFPEGNVTFPADSVPFPEDEGSFPDGASASAVASEPAASRYR